MKKIITGLVGFMLAGAMATTQADNLQQVYQQALKSDPTYQQAQAQMLANKGYVTIARTAYFPQILAAGTYNHTYTKAGHNSVFAGPKGNWLNPWNYNITLTQPILSFSLLAGIKGAGMQSKAAILTYMYARQQLMQRTAKDYFNVLSAYDTLRYDVAYVQSLYQQLVTATQKYKVGLSAKTDVYQAQSKYDLRRSKEIFDRNQLASAIENLRAITGKKYEQLAGINVQVPLVNPNPNNQDAWVSAALRQNYSLQSQVYLTQFQKEQISALSDQILPVLNATGSLGGGRAIAGKSLFTGSTASVGLSLGINFQGGASFAQASQQRHLYMVAVGLLDFTHRGVVANTRNDYLNVLSGISAVKADKVAINSSRSSYDATEAGYRVGTQTMDALLNNLADIYGSQQQHATDQYAYLNNTIALKLDAGTLNEKDLATINSWLTKKIDVNPKTAFTAKQIKIQKRVRKSKQTTNKRPLKTKPASSQRARPIKKHSNVNFKQHASNHKIGAYTLQLFAAKDLTTTQNYVTTLPMNNQITILHIGSWYKVVYGHYQTHATAKEALKNISSIYKKDNPWVYHVKRAATRHLQQVAAPKVTDQNIYPSNEQTLAQQLQKATTHNTLPQP